MKLTWFAGTTFRVQLGGVILVTDPEGAGAGVSLRELLSGADLVVRFDDPALAEKDASAWAPRRPEAMIAGEAAAPVLWRAGGVVVAEVPGEAPLAIAHGPAPQAGRWTREAVVVACGPQAAFVAEAVLDRWGPRLIALAAPEAELDKAFAALAGRMADTGLVALEPGLALEV
jgi:hypothetical protein